MAPSACGAPISKAGDGGGRGLQRGSPWDLEDAGSFVSGVLTPLGLRGPGGQVGCRIPATKEFAETWVPLLLLPTHSDGWGSVLLTHLRGVSKACTGETFWLYKLLTGPECCSGRA